MTKFPIHSGAIYLVGRGSGANMAYLLGIRNPDLFAGVIAINGRIQPELLDPEQIKRAAPRLPVMIVHDKQDRSLSPAMLTEMREFFGTHLFTSQLREYQDKDTMSDLLFDGITWINERRAELPKTPSENKPLRSPDAD
jgi:predicted esterase